MWLQMLFSLFSVSLNQDFCLHVCVCIEPHLFSCMFIQFREILWEFFSLTVFSSTQIIWYPAQSCFPRCSLLNPDSYEQIEQTSVVLRESILPSIGNIAILLLPLSILQPATYLFIPLLLRFLKELLMRNFSECKCVFKRSLL